MNIFTVKRADWTASYHDQVTKEAFQALADDLKKETEKLKSEYVDADATIKADIAKYRVKIGHSRRLRLNMPLPVLGAHMLLRKMRASAQRQLLVLTPLLKLTRIILEQWDKPDHLRWDLTTVPLYVLRRLVEGGANNYQLRTQRYFIGEAERHMLAEVAKRHPMVIPELTLARAVKQAHAHPEPDSERAALYRKIVTQVPLNETELNLLSLALLKTVAVPSYLSGTDS